MGGYDPNNYDDVSTFLTFPNDSDDEDDAMTPTPTLSHRASEEKGMSALLSPPSSSAEGEAIDQDDDDDLYGAGIPENPWKSRRESSVSVVESPVNPQWLLSSDPARADAQHPSPPQSDDAKTPKDGHRPRSGHLETIQEKNEQLLKKTGGPVPKTSKSFPLLPSLLNLKHAEDEDEKILQSEEGKKLNPKERRQLRNKVSARNFRVRRKEYIGHLESLVESQNQEIEQLRQTLDAVRLENSQLRQESGFLRSLALNHQPPLPSSQQPQDSVITHPNKDINPNTFEWPLAYDGSQSPTQPNNKFADRPMFGGHIHAYGVRVPEVQFDKPHLTNPSNGLAPPLPPPPSQQYTPGSSQEAPKSPTGQQAFPPGAENLGYPGMLQAVSYLYDYIVKASGPIMQPQQPPVNGYPQPAPYHQQPQQWADAKVMGAPALGFNPYFNGSWGWGGPPSGPAV